MTTRFVASIIIFISLMIFPYWVYLPLIFVGILLFPLYLEGLVFAFLVEVLYGEGVGLVPSLLTSTVTVAVIAMIFFRERLRFYA